MGAAYTDQVVSHVRNQRQALIQLLQRMVNAESPSSQPGSHRLIRSVLKDALSSIDYKVCTTVERARTSISMRAAITGRKSMVRNCFSDITTQSGHWELY